MRYFFRLLFSLEFTPNVSSQQQHQKKKRQKGDGGAEDTHFLIVLLYCIHATKSFVADYIFPAFCVSYIISRIR